ncbi:MAG: DUF86 domain-containing protein [Candidatus Portnoybacteria bacterium]|nr:DUF86 domain-containing protein [Candidatus Portnoybacteria bacterium]
MSRDPGLYCDDILQSIQKIENFTSGMSLSGFRDDIKTQDAVIRNFEIIGEAVKNISEEIKKKYPEVSWRSAGDMRDFLIHEYPDVIIDIVWRAVVDDLPRFKDQISYVMKEEGL